MCGMRPNAQGIVNNCRSLPILDAGSCEPLKAAFHGAALGLAALMGAYNTAAWWRRRQSHLALNAVIYIAAVFWERGHVTHHMTRCLPSPAIPDAGADRPVPDEREAA
jgi:hypothetical protein